MSIPYLVVIPLVVGFSAQFLKFIIHIFQRNFQLSYINSYGGFPSAHTAFITSITTIAWLAEGTYSLIFAVCVVTALITIRDALGIRVFVSQHGYILNRLIKDVCHDGQHKKYPRLEENLGHKFGEVMGGAVIGTGFSYVLFEIFVR